MRTDSSPAPQPSVRRARATVLRGHRIAALSDPERNNMHAATPVADVPDQLDVLWKAP